MSEIKKIKEQYLSKLNEYLDQNKLNEIKTELFGKNGIISTKFKQLGSVTEEERKDYSTELNLLKNELQELISKKTEEIQNQEINKKLKDDNIDVTLPGRTYFAGKIHPVSQVIDVILQKIIQHEICMILFILIILKIYFYEHIHRQFKLEQC